MLTDKKSGYIMISIVIFLSIIFTILTTLLSVSAMQKRTASSYADGIAAYNVAQNGIYLLVEDIIKNGCTNYAYGPEDTSIIGFGKSALVTISAGSDDGSVYYLTSKATYNGHAYRQIRATAIRASTGKVYIAIQEQIMGSPTDIPLPCTKVE